MKEAGAAATKEEIAAALKRAVALANADPGKPNSSSSAIR